MADKKFINLDNLIHFWDGGGSAGAKKYIDDKDSEIKAETSAVSSSLSSHSNTPASTLKMGHVKIGANISVNGDTISLSQSNVTDALGYTPPMSDTTYSTATTSYNGLMSSSMVTKLNGIDEGANYYTLPEASSSTLGGVKIGSYFFIGHDGILRVDEVDQSNPGVVPPTGYSAGGTIATQSTEWVLTTTSGGAPTWKKLPSNAFKNDGTTYSTATTSYNGLMSSSMVTKLNGIDEGANYYTLPKATNSALGGVKLGSNILSDENDSLYIKVVNQTDPGIVPPTGTSADNTIATQSTEWVLTTTSGGDPAWRKLPSNAFKNTTYSTATTSYNGLMSSSMVSKLNGIDEGANYYSLPNATSSRLGGVKIGDNISVNGGTISLSQSNVTDALGYTPPMSDTTYSTATTSYNGLMSSSMVTKLNNIDSYANYYTLPNATGSILGGVKIGSNISVSSGTISLSKSNVEAALGYTIVVGSSVPSSAPSNQITFVI